LSKEKTGREQRRSVWMLRRQALVKERSRRSVKGLKQQRSRAEEGVLGVGLQKTAEMDEVRYPFRRLGANAVNGGKRRPRGDELRDAGEQSEPRAIIICNSQDKIAEDRLQIPAHLSPGVSDIQRSGRDQDEVKMLSRCDQDVVEM
jgi:hypothetical protein